MSIKLRPSPTYHGACFVLLLLVQSSTQNSCNNHVVCRGERPLLPNGCCPVEAGQSCQPANGTYCDAELGFSCLNAESDGIGLCHGLFNLQVTSVGETNITLTWSPFAPPGYMFEYVLLLREKSYHIDTDQWRIREIGIQPSYTLRRLTPATLYFIKVALWEDARAQILGNTSETIMAETLSVEFCEHRGSSYSVGQQFVHNCEDNCTCLPSGQFKCTPLCPEMGVPELADGCQVTLGDACCEYRIVCAVEEEPCVLNEHVYSHGEQFEIGCRFCTCTQGQVDCEYPEECHVMESTDSCPYPRSRDVEGQCCPEWYCANTCSHANQTYSHLEYFTSDHCGLCQCDTVSSVHCAPDCPPVEMVLPDAACPDPHIRQDGCCDTLYCHDLSLDITHYIQRLYAMSYSPVTLTLSFEVESQSEVDGVPLYCQYEILYANTSDPFVTWNRRLVQPVDVRLHHDQPHLMEPTEALTRENAIVVGDRAYVTLSGMYPNTTYYVKIIPLDGNLNDMSASSPSSDSSVSNNSKITAMVVVKTMPLENITSCFHTGKEVQHGDHVSGHCGQVCMCTLGRITCHSSCEAEQVVMARSPTCPQPRLEKQEGDCCPEWTCYPSARGCRYGTLILESGQSVTEGCQVCICTNASVHCRSLCPPSGLSPRPGCKLVNISGHCCPQWQCQLETHLPYGIKSSVLIHFYGTCQASVASFLEDMKMRIVNHVTSHMGCPSNESDFAKFCKSVQVQILCPALSGETREYRRRRSAAHSGSEHPRISVVISVHMNFSSTTPDLVTAQHVKSAGLHLMTLLNSSFSILLDSGHIMTSSEGAQFKGESFICDPGFSFINNFCVLSEIESSLSFNPVLQLTPAEVTSNSVILQWPSLGDQILKHITGLLIEHRKEGSIQWFSSSKLDPILTSYNITSLSSDQSFSAQLVALTAWSGKDRWKIGEVHFRTRPTLAGAVSLRSIFTLNEVVVAENCAFFYWNHLPDQSQMIAVNILYKQTHQGLYTNKQHVSPVTKTYVQLKNLQPNTAYTAELVLLASDVTFTSLPVHFVTLATRSSSAELLIAVVVSCVVTAVTSVVLSLSCIIWWRSRKKGKSDGFENKIYGIQLENNNDEVNSEPASNPAIN